MARFDRNVRRPRLPLLRPQQVLVLVVVVLAGMAGQTGANVACVQPTFNGIYNLAETDGKCPVPEMNAAFAGKMDSCYYDMGQVSRVCACARCVHCAAVFTYRGSSSFQHLDQTSVQT